MMSVELPKTLGGTADKLFRLRAKRLVSERRVEAMKAEERKLKSHAGELLKKDHLESARGKFATVTRNVKAIPTVEDWDALYEFIAKNDAFELLQKRPALGACRERWDNEEVIPGVKRDTLIDISVTKVPAR